VDRSGISAGGGCAFGAEPLKLSWTVAGSPPEADAPSAQNRLNFRGP